MAISKIRKLICSELTLRCRQLTATEKEKLAEHEAIIEKHLDAFYKVGFALMQIRDKGLFRETHDTFEDYVNDRWGFSRPRAYQLIKAVEVQDNLSTICRQTLTESVCRPLSKFTPEQQREIYQIAVETAPAGGRVTAKHIEEMIEERLGLNAEELEKAGNEPARVETCVISPEDIRRAHREMTEEEFQARKDTEEDRMKERLEKEARRQKRDIARGVYIEQAFNRSVFFGKGQRLRGKRRKLFISIRRTAWFMLDFLRREKYRVQRIKTDLQGISEELGRDKFTTLLNQKYIKDFKTSPCIRDIIAIMQLLGFEVKER